MLIFIIKLLYPYLFNKPSKACPSINVIGLSCAKSYASFPYELVVTKIPLVAPSCIIVPYKSLTADTGTTLLYLFACITNFPPLIGSSSNAIASTPPS